MKLTDFLSDVGRPVAYYPSLRRITGSTNATILLCQFIYWKGKEADADGWLYKESDEIENETGLSYGEQKTARRLLVEAGLIEEYYARLDHQMRFRLNLEAINDKWGMSETSIPESGKPQFGNDAKPLSLNESETTTENTNTPKKQKMQLKGIEAAMFGGREVTEEDIPSADEALKAFERDMQCPGSWTWYPAKSTDEPAWKSLREFVVTLYQSDPKAFEKYRTWAAQPFSRGVKTVGQIRLDPTCFEYAWADYQAANPSAESSQTNGRTIGT